MNFKITLASIICGLSLATGATPAFSHSGSHPVVSSHTGVPRLPHLPNGKWAPFKCIGPETGAFANSTVGRDGTRVVDIATVSNIGKSQAGLYLEPTSNALPKTLSFVYKAPSLTVANSPLCFFGTMDTSPSFNIVFFSTQTPTSNGYTLVTVDLTNSLLDLTAPAEIIAIFNTESNGGTARIGSVTYNGKLFSPSLHGKTVNTCFQTTEPPEK